MTTIDTFFSIGLGLGLRALIDIATNQNATLAGILVGLWEGAVLHHFLNSSSSRSSSSLDTFIGYVIRIVVDYLWTENSQRLMVVLLWTGLGMLLSDLWPAISYVVFKVIYRCYRRTRQCLYSLDTLFSTASALPARVRFYVESSASSSVSGSSVSQRRQPRRRSSRPIPGAYTDTSTITDFPESMHGLSSDGESEGPHFRQWEIPPGGENEILLTPLDGDDENDDGDDDENEHESTHIYSALHVQQDHEHNSTISAPLASATIITLHVDQPPIAQFDPPPVHTEETGKGAESERPFEPETEQQEQEESRPPSPDPLDPLQTPPLATQPIPPMQGVFSDQNSNGYKPYTAPSPSAFSVFDTDQLQPLGVPVLNLPQGNGDAKKEQESVEETTRLDETTNAEPIEGLKDGEAAKVTPDDKIPGGQENKEQETIETEEKEDNWVGIKKKDKDKDKNKGRKNKPKK